MTELVDHGVLLAGTAYPPPDPLPPRGVGVPEAARLVGARHPHAKSVYRRIYNLVLDGRVPAVQVAGRWVINPEHLGLIEERLALTEQATAA